MKKGQLSFLITFVMFSMAVNSHKSSIKPITVLFTTHPITVSHKPCTHLHDKQKKQWSLCISMVKIRPNWLKRTWAKLASSNYFTNLIVSKWIKLNLVKPTPKLVKHKPARPKHSIKKEHKKVIRPVWN